MTNEEKVEKIIHDIDGLLDAAKERAVAQLTPAVIWELKKDQGFSCFELFHCQNYSLLYNRFYLKEANGKSEIDSDFAYYMESEDSILPELNDYIEKFFQQGNELTESEGQLFTERHETQLLAWFSDCWKAAGGEQAQIPTYFSFEREYLYRDMFSGDVLEESEVFERLGYTIKA